jgi:hypothetical protein
MEIFIPIIVILALGGMGLLLVQAGRNRIKALNEQDANRAITSLQSLVAIFQIMVGCVGILIAISQIITLTIEVIQAFI